MRSNAVNVELYGSLKTIIPALKNRLVCKLVLTIELDALPTLEITERLLPSDLAKPGTDVKRFTLTEMKEEANNGGQG